MKIDSAQFVVSAHGPGDFVRDDRPEVAFVGRSNVGKSSLLNRLLGRRALARISSTPGRTRAVNYFLINERIYFVDLPGYGWARAAQSERQEWAELVEQYFLQALPRGAVLVQLVDAKVGATPLDVQAWEYLVSLGGAPLVVATKIDRVGRSKRSPTLLGVRQTLGLAPEAALIPCSARSGEGIKEVWRELTSALAVSVS